MHAAEVVSDFEQTVGTSARRQEAARKAPRTNLVPGNALQLEEPLPVDELAAREPRERAAFEDLEMHG
jgi:hypothetical protein